MKAQVLLIFVSIMTMIVTVPTSPLTNQVDAEKYDRPNELCSDYGGKWNENKNKTYNKIKRPF